MIDRTLDRPRVTTIDGEDYVVEVCDEDCCPFYWDDDGCMPMCLHPKGDRCAYWDDGTIKEWWSRCFNSNRGKVCPLRVKV